jgi:hypothetical protein
VVAVFAVGFQALADGPGVGQPAESFETCEQLFIGKLVLGFGGNANKNVEVVGEDAISDDLESAEAGVFAHEREKLIPLVWAKEKLAIHNARDAMVKSDFVSGWCLESSLTHKVKSID